ncbi:MAG: helix-turn-helix domain-containing protein [Bacteroidia bacterium]
MQNAALKEWHYFLAGAFFFLLALTPAMGQKHYYPALFSPFSESWRWKSLDVAEGKGVQAVYEDKEDHIWFATDHNILEYDGYRLIPHKITGDTANPVFDITATPQGNLIAVSASEVYSYNGEIWQPLFSLDTATHGFIRAVSPLKSGAMLVSASFGVILLSSNQRPVCFSDSSLIRQFSPHLPDIRWVALPVAFSAGHSPENFTSAIQTEDGKFWIAADIGSEGRLIALTPPAEGESVIMDFRIYSSTPDYPLGAQQKLLQSGDGKIWAINDDFDLGVSIFDGKKWEHLRLSDNVNSDEFTTDIAETEDGTLWFGCMGLIHSLNAGKWNTYKAPQYQVPANRIRFSPGKNRLWVMGIRSRVFFIDYSTDHWQTFPGLNFQCQTREGVKWFIEADGRVVSETNGSWVAWDTLSGLMDAPVRLLHTSHGQLWAAGSHKGIAATALFSGERWEMDLHPTLSWGIDYRAAFEAADGSIWFGSSVDHVEQKGHQGGVICLPHPLSQPRNWISHPGNANGLNQYNAYGLAQSPDGTLWVGGSHLLGFDGKTWFPAPDERLYSYVNSLHNCSNLLVAGTRLYDIFTFDGHTWKNYTIDSGLTSNTIISVYAESDVSIWAVTEDDICRFDGNRWQCGLFPKEMNMPAEGGEIRYDSGSVWITKVPREWKRKPLKLGKKVGNLSREEIVSYRYIPDKNPPMTVSLTSTKSGRLSQTVTFQWEGQDFLNYTAKDQIFFSFRVNEGEWSPFLPQNTVSIESLPAGNHVVEVRARDNDMNIEHSPRKLNFQVVTPLWEQYSAGFFITILFTLVFALILFIYFRPLFPAAQPYLAITTAEKSHSSDSTATPEEEVSAEATAGPELSSVQEIAPAPVQVTSSDEKLISRLMEIMEENLSDANFNVNKMCEMVNLSHMHFIRKIKQLTGMKPQELLRSFRMKRARDLLSQNKLSVAEISYMVGYDLPNSFTRAFKKEFGVTPSEFAENIRNQAE